MKSNTASYVSPQFVTLCVIKLRTTWMPVRLFTCNIWMLIKGYLRNYNGVIKATLRGGDSAPYASRSREGRWMRSGPGVPAARSSLLNSNPRALYQHLIPVSICLKMAANAGSMFQYWKRFDLQQLQVSSTSTQILYPLLPSAVWFLFGSAFCVFRQPSLRCFGREFKTSSSHWWKWLSRWSEIDPLCSIQHRSDTATEQARATPRGCAKIKAKRPGFGEKLSVGYLYCVLFNFYRSE